MGKKKPLRVVSDEATIHHCHFSVHSSSPYPGVWRRNIHRHCPSCDYWQSAPKQAMSVMSSVCPNDGAALVRGKRKKKPPFRGAE